MSLHDALPATFWSLDTPAGPLLIAPCLHPESNQERPDLPLSIACPDHGRSVYWCEDQGVLWCDGGPPDYAFHELDIA